MKNKLFLYILLISSINLTGQNNNTTFGIQYKPIIPAKYFNSSYIDANSSNYNLNLMPKYSSSFGMIIRKKLTKTFSVESGLNYTERNYKLTIINNTIDLEDFSAFGMRSYEIPLQILTYVQISKLWYLNVSFGISHNVLASDIYSQGENKNYFQNTYRKNGGYRALLANIGIEYRTEKKRSYYIGTTLHRPWGEIGRAYPEYNDGENIFNDSPFENKLFLEIIGNFITIDFRYFFEE